MGKGSGTKGKGAAKKAAASAGAAGLRQAGLDAQVAAIEAVGLAIKTDGGRVYLDALQGRLAAQGMTLQQMEDALWEGQDRGKWVLVQNDLASGWLDRPSLAREREALASPLSKRLRSTVSGRDYGWFRFPRG